MTAAPYAEGVGSALTCCMSGSVGCRRSLFEPSLSMLASEARGSILGGERCDIRCGCAHFFSKNSPPAVTIGKDDASAGLCNVAPFERAIRPYPSHSGE